MKFIKILTFVFIFSAFSLIVLKTADAQSAGILCGIKSVDYNGSNHGPGADAVQIPDNTQFSLNISCTGQNSTSPSPQVNVTVGGNTLSQNVSVFASTVAFGPFPGLSASSVPAQSVLPFPVAFQSPDYVITCTSVTFTTVCTVNVQNTAPGGSPVATPLPVPGSETAVINVESTGCNNVPSCIQQSKTITGTTSATFTGLTPNTSFDVYVSVAGTPQPNFNPKSCQTDVNGALWVDWLAVTCVPGTNTGVSGQNPCLGGFCITGLGKIPTTVQGFSTTILGIATGLGGGFALILLVMGSIQVLTSSGDQQKMGAGRERIVAALAGLLFIIFAVLILQFIGISILGGLPGF